VHLKGDVHTAPGMGKVREKRELPYFKAFQGEGRFYEDIRMGGREGKTRVTMLFPDLSLWLGFV